MILKKRNFILTIIIIILIQILIYKNNSQKFNFRYFIWNTQELNVGQLITVSFISGLFLSTIFNSSLENLYKTSNNTHNKIEDKNNEDNIVEKNYESDTEIPPQRDIRDPQPTISVNYRVIKNNEKNNLNMEESKRNNEKYQDDWISDEQGW